MAIEAIDGKLASAEALDGYVGGLLRGAGVDAASAGATARAVVDASSRGVDTHGVRLVPWYLEAVEGGRINRRPAITVERKAAAVRMWTPTTGSVTRRASGRSRRAAAWRRRPESLRFRWGGRAITGRPGFIRWRRPRPDTLRSA